MSSFTRFVSKANSMLSDVFGALGIGGEGCTFTLSGGGESVSFPVSPASFEVSLPSNNQTVNVISIGDVNMIGNAGLASLKFESFFPSNEYPFVNDMTATGAYEYVAKVKKMQTGKEPCQISISGTDVSLPVTIETFEYGEKDGSGDVYFSLQLREYKFVSPASEATNSVTGMKGRMSDVLKEKPMTCLGGLDMMDTAQKAIQRTTSIAKQCKRVVNTYRAMAKSGGIRPGVLLKTTAKGIFKAGGKLPMVKW